MVRDLRYILKRIIIGVGIALILAFIKMPKANAMAVISGNMGNHAFTINNQTTGIDFGINSPIYGNYHDYSGYIYLSFAINKQSGTATDPFPAVRGVSVSTGDNNAFTFLCDIGSSSFNNSTFLGMTYSVKCPVVMTSTGLNHVYVGFVPVSQPITNDYTLSFSSGTSFEIVENGNVNVNVDTSSTTSAINNQTNSITNNQNQNTQSIINNQNQNTQNTIESQKVCKDYGKSAIITNNKKFDSSGNLVNSSAFGITDYIKINNSSTLKVIRDIPGDTSYFCFFNTNKSLISCVANNTLHVDDIISIPTNTSYVRFSINFNTDRPNFTICTNGNQSIVDSQQDINNTLNNDNVDSSTGVDFFSNFQSDSHGLSGIITAPLRLITSLSSSQCQSLVIPLPFVNQNATIPCMSTVYSRFPTFLSLWQLITTGLIAYWILIKIFGHVKGMQSPTDDRIEVLDL